MASLRKLYVKIPSEKSLLYESTENVAAIIGSKKLEHTEEFKFLNKVAIEAQDYKIKGGALNPWRLCTATQVEKLKIIVRLLPIRASGIVFRTVYSQMSTMFVLQGNTLDHHMGPHFEIPSALLSIFDILSIIAWVPMYDLVIVPTVCKVTGHERGFTQLTQIGISFIISIFSMLAVGVLEVIRLHVVVSHILYDSKVYVPMSIFWKIPQYFIIGVVEEFTNIGQLDFFYDQAPDAEAVQPRQTVKMEFKQ